MVQVLRDSTISASIKWRAPLTGSISILRTASSKCGLLSGILAKLDANIPSNNNNRFQQLELKWVNDHGCFGAMEFR